jgi:hypothetical protein
VTLRARWVTLRARWVTLRARWVTLRARWVTLRARWVDSLQRGARDELRAEVVFQLTGNRNDHSKEDELWQAMEKHNRQLLREAQPPLQLRARSPDEAAVATAAAVIAAAAAEAVRWTLSLLGTKRL